MTAWQEMTPEQKREAVAKGRSDGLTLDGIAAALGTGRNAVAGVINRYKVKGSPLPGPAARIGRPAKPKKPAPRAAKPKKPAPKKTAKKFNIVRKSHSGVMLPVSLVKLGRPPVQITRADAFLPLPGIAPVSFVENTGCKWPVDVSGTKAPMCCGAPRLGDTYCAAHAELGLARRAS